MHQNEDKNRFAAFLLVQCTQEHMVMPHHQLWCAAMHVRQRCVALVFYGAVKNEWHPNMLTHATCINVLCSNNHYCNAPKQRNVNGPKRYI